MREQKYKEILELYDYCLKIHIPSVLEDCWDGFAIRFPSGGDFVQHDHSYGSHSGCVEPAIGSRLDYSPVPLKNAKLLVKRRKEKLCGKEGEQK